MKSITEFNPQILKKAILSIDTLTTEGKTPEELDQTLTETYKVEGEKLGHLKHASQVAKSNIDSLRRVLVYQLAEGETAPAGALVVETFAYFPEIFTTAIYKKPVEDKKKGKGGKGKRDR